MCLATCSIDIHQRGELSIYVYYYIRYNKGKSKDKKTRRLTKVKEQVTVFLDESGKDKNKISLIGSVLIPNSIYHSKQIRELNTRLRNNEVHYHLTEYRNSEIDSYKELFQIMLKNVSTLKFNAVAFKRGRFSSHTLSGRIDDMVYSKIPERTLYGSLRGYNSFTNIEADIFIEYALEYEARQLDKLIKKQLNTHSLYRFDNFKVNNVKLKGKNNEIGIEFTDVCLGILRQILENNDLKNPSNQTGNISKNLAYKKRLIYMLLSEFSDFFRNIDLFELDDKGMLERVDIDKYIKLFIAKYFKELELYSEFDSIVNYNITKKTVKKYGITQRNRRYKNRSKFL